MKNSRRLAVYGMLGSLFGFAWLACKDSAEGYPAGSAASGSVDTGPGTGSSRGGSTGTPLDETAGSSSGAVGTPGSAEQTSADIPLDEADGDAPDPVSGAEAPTAPASDGPDASVPSAPEQGCPATATAAAGETTQTLTVGGQTRSYVLHVPPGYTGDERVPVVFDFHGLGGNGSQQRNLSGWADVADREGFIMVYPNGSSNAWNVGRCCPPAADQGVDDVAFVRAVVERLKSEACIDSRRIYASGCSNGGGMSYKLACEAADLIAGVAPVDFDCVVGEQNVPSCGGCNPARPITEVQFRATGDTLVNYFGGPAPIPQGMDFPGAEQNFADWGEINQCTGEPTPLESNAACQTFPACAAGVQTTLCTRQGGSLCGNYQALDIANVAWAQFENAVLP